METVWHFQNVTQPMLHFAKRIAENNNEPNRKRETETWKTQQTE